MAVKNDAELRAWLEKQTQETCTAIAHRAAMRVLPFAVDVEGFDGAERLALATFRATLTSGVAALGPTSDVRDAALSAHSAALSADSDSALSALSAHSAALSAAHSAAHSAARSTAHSADSAHSAALSTAHSTALSAADSAARSARSAAYADAGREVAGLMWVANPVPDVIAEDIARFRAAGRSALDAGGPWAFWAEWYAGAMEGKPLDWALQEQIALIPEDVWKEGVEAVAKEIARIRAELSPNPLDDGLAGAMVEQLLLDPVVSADLFAHASHSITLTIGVFEQRAQMNGLPDGFMGLSAIAGVYLDLSEALRQSDQKNREIEALKAKIQSLYAVIGALRQELRDVRQDYMGAKHSPYEASRLSAVGRIAKEAILLSGALAAIPAGLLATDQLRERWSAEYLQMRAEAYSLIETMETAEATTDQNVKK